jgi:glycosyltransferase involved in cell wall biosynthesis
MIQNSIFYPNVVGGAELSTYHLACALSERGHRVDVLTTTGRRRGFEQGLHTRRLDGISGEILEAPSAGLYDLTPEDGTPRPGILRRGAHHFAAVHSPRWARLADLALARLRPDVLHTNTIVGMTPAIWRSARDLGIPVVHTLRDYHLLCPRTTLVRSSGDECERAPLPCRVLRSAKRHAAVGVVLVTAPSRFVLERHLGYGFFRGAQTAVVPNAYAGPLPAPAPLAGATAGEPLQGLFLGQIDVHKGIRVLLQALERLFADPDAAALRFAFAGRGALVDEIVAFCERHRGRAIYHGVVRGEEKERLLAASSFLVLPSIWNDNFPRTLLEAFAHGLPVIGARRGGIPEVVEDDVSGRIVEPQPDVVATAIADYVGDRERLRRHGRQARARVADFTLERQVDTFLELYRRAAAEEPVAGANAAAGRGSVRD